MKCKLSIMVSLVILMMTISCISKEEQHIQAHEIAQQQFDEIDLTVPDSYPQFDGCDELENDKDCFYQKLHAQINQKLQLENLDLQISKADTLTAIIKVSRTGNIDYTGLQNISSEVQTAKLDSVLTARLTDMPQVHPAIKHGVPVESTYLLPIIIKPVD